MRFGTFDDREIRVIRELIEDGLTVAEIARRLERPARAVWRWLTRHDMAPTATHIPLSQSEEQSLQHLTAAGVPAKVAAKLCARTIGSMYQLRWRRGLHRPSRFPHQLRFRISDHANEVLEARSKDYGIPAAYVARSVLELCVRQHGDLAQKIVTPAAERPAPLSSAFSPMLQARA
jgi:hypothetical protein